MTKVVDTSRGNASWRRPRRVAPDIAVGSRVQTSIVSRQSVNTVEISPLNYRYPNHNQNRRSVEGTRVLERNTKIYYSELEGEPPKYYIKHENDALEEISEQIVQAYLNKQPHLNIEFQLQKLFSNTESLPY